MIFLRKGSVTDNIRTLSSGFEKKSGRKANFDNLLLERAKENSDRYVLFS